MPEVALFGGSFDPPHVGHLLAAAYVLATEPVDELWFVPVLQHPFDKPLVAPYEHLDTIAVAKAEQLSEMMQLAQRCIGALQKLYRPEGFNIGMNLGQAAGAGIREHFHLHVVPRWVGDANFMSIVGETRVLPEELGQTYERLKSAL